MYVHRCEWNQSSCQSIFVRHSCAVFSPKFKVLLCKRLKKSAHCTLWIKEKTPTAYFTAYPLVKKIMYISASVRLPKALYEARLDPVKSFKKNEITTVRLQSLILYVLLHIHLYNVFGLLHEWEAWQCHLYILHRSLSFSVFSTVQIFGLSARPCQ